MWGEWVGRVAEAVGGQHALQLVRDPGLCGRMRAGRVGQGGVGGRVDVGGVDVGGWQRPALQLVRDLCLGAGVRERSGQAGVWGG